MYGLLHCLAMERGVLPRKGTAGDCGKTHCGISTKQLEDTRDISEHSRTRRENIGKHGKTRRQNIRKLGRRHRQKVRQRSRMHRRRIRGSIAGQLGGDVRKCDRTGDADSGMEQEEGAHAGWQVPQTKQGAL